MLLFATTTYAHLCGTHTHTAYRYVVVSVVEVVANCAGLPPDVIGVTILAVGTSAPDTFGSVIAAKKVPTHMASNTLCEHPQHPQHNMTRANARALV